MLVAVFPAFAVDDLDDDCKWSPSGDPIALKGRHHRRRQARFAVLVRARSETRKGHAVYRTIQVCP
jgi:hypothetical protein